MVYILTEAGKTKGLGHFTRMTAVCEGLLKNGIDVEMWLDADKAVKSITTKSFVRHINRVEDFFNILVKDKDVVIVDSYHIDLATMNKIKSRCKRLIVIDDNMRLGYQDSIVLNPNYFAEFIKYPEGKGNVYYKGNEYTLLREEFNTISDHVMRNPVREILITMGGTDVKKITAHVIRYLKGINEFVRLNVVITSSYDNTDEISELLGINDTLHKDISASKMSILMQQADFAIASAGGTTNELIKALCPAVLIGVADNQVLNLKYLGANGIIKEFNVDNMKPIEEMFSYEERIGMYEKMKERFSKRTGVDLVVDIVKGELNEKDTHCS